MKENHEASEAALEGADLGVVLGSGLGGVSDPFETEAVVPFDAVPGLGASRVSGHPGEIRRCAVAGRSCIFVRGRKHHYEGRPGEIAAVIECLHRAGIGRLLLTSAAGSLTPALAPGEFVLAEGIIDLQFRRPPARRVRAARGGGTPGRGPLPPRPGRRGLLEPDPALCDGLRAAAAAVGLPLAVGTLVSCAGPSYETPAEVRALQRTGATVVSMSGAPEMTFAASLGIRVATLALITNWATGISGSKLDHGEVLHAGGRKTAILGRLIAKFIGSQ